MAVEDYFDVWGESPDEDECATPCRFCGVLIWFEELPRRKWKIYDYATGEPHVCTGRVATAKEFPLETP